MPISEARKRANKKWDAEHIKHCSIAMNIELYEKARAVAEEEEKSFNKFLCDCIEEHMKAREREEIQ